ncbi:MAG: histone deacetylase [Candidatus Thermoplasmatota archaeon]|nr:histone deacetylase [Candidatus Thermoplasmatota archaeon]
MKTQVFYSKEFHKHDNIGHPENAERLTVMMDELRNSPFFESLEMVEPSILPEKILYEIHSTRMISQIKAISKQGNSWVDLDTYVSKDDFKTSRIAAGAVVNACTNVLNGKAKNAFSLVRPPGHHATKDRSMGFCLFNNTALAANEIAKKGKKVLIFDNDVHHGNGTQDIFYDRSDVMYQSIHLSPHFPGTGDIDEIGVGKGEGYTINAPFSYGTGDESARELLDEVFLPIANRFKPDLIIFSVGFDSHHTDPFGGLKYSANIFGEMIKKYQKIQPKIVCTLEGGYSFDWMGKCLISNIGEMVGEPIEIDDNIKEDVNAKATIKKIKNKWASYWKI